MGSPVKRFIERSEDTLGSSLKLGAEPKESLTQENKSPDASHVLRLEEKELGSRFSAQKQREAPEGSKSQAKESASQSKPEKTSLEKSLLVNSRLLQKVLREIRPFFVNRANPLFEMPLPPTAFELKAFPDFSGESQSEFDVCQNFTFLRLRRFQEQFRRFADVNKARLAGVRDANPQLADFLTANLDLSLHAVQRLTRLVVTEVSQALALYSGFLLKYDRIIKAGIESLNALLVDQVALFAQYIDRLSPVPSSSLNVPFTK